MRLTVCQHVPFEGPAAIADWARDRGHTIDCVPLFAGDPLPPPYEIEAAVIMGGPMSVNDTGKHPWLRGEIECLQKLVERGIPLLGICLGAQLLAHAMGARVFRNPLKEIGWFPIELTAEGKEHPLTSHLPAECTAFHWHGDTFDLPEGAVHLAQSEACAQQIFVRGPVLGLQCHLEVTPPAVEGLADQCKDDIGRGPFEQQAPKMVSAAGTHCEKLRPLLFTMLDAWVQEGR